MCCCESPSLITPCCRRWTAHGRGGRRRLARAHGVGRSGHGLGLNIAGVDLIRAARGPLVLEVNSTPGLEGIESVCGVDVAGCIVEHLAAQAE